MIHKMRNSEIMTLVYKCSGQYESPLPQNARGTQSGWSGWYWGIPTRGCYYAIYLGFVYLFHMYTSFADQFHGIHCYSNSEISLLQLLPLSTVVQNLILFTLAKAFDIDHGTKSWVVNIWIFFHVNMKTVIGGSDSINHLYKLKRNSRISEDLIGVFIF